MTVTEEVRTTQHKFGKQEALQLAAESTQLYATKSRKSVHVPLGKKAPSDDEIASLLLGPTGNLRAPTLRIGKSLVVGFDEDSLKKLLKI